MQERGHYLFVYGLLQPDEQTGAAQLLRDHAHYCGPASTTGNIFLVSYYPAYTPSCDVPSKIFGHLYFFPEHASDTNFILKQLDYFEECTDDFPHPHEYVRAKIDVHFKSKIVNAWAYIYNRSTEDLLPIYNGVFSTDHIDIKIPTGL